MYFFGKKEVRIYCFGDSHSLFFSYLKNCKPVYCGSRLAYKLPEALKTILDLITELLNNEHPEDYYILFTFGEIISQDCQVR